MGQKLHQDDAGRGHLTPGEIEEGTKAQRLREGIDATTWSEVVATELHAAVTGNHQRRSMTMLM
jgi:hypothetical protein